MASADGNRYKVLNSLIIVVGVVGSIVFAINVWIKKSIEDDSLPMSQHVEGVIKPVASQEKKEDNKMAVPNNGNNLTESNRMENGRPFPSRHPQNASPAAEKEIIHEPSIKDDILLE